MLSKPHRVAGWILTLGMPLVFVACGGDSTGPASPANIAGTWAFTTNVSNPSLQVSCLQSGTASITQTGSQFSGTAVGTQDCTGPGGEVVLDVNGPITGGNISGSTISFVDADGCNYHGSASGSPVNRISGSVSCIVPLQGVSYTLSGSWQGSR